MRVRDPLGKLACVWNGGRQEGESRCARRQHNALLPHHAALHVAQVVDLVVHYQRRLPASPTVGSGQGAQSDSTVRRLLGLAVHYQRRLAVHQQLLSIKQGHSVG